MLRGNCHSKEGSFPIYSGNCPEGVLAIRVIGRGVVVQGGNCPSG